MKLKHPSDIKCLGDSIPMSPSWRSKSLDMMWSLLNEKFKILSFKEALLETGSAPLVHKVGSKFWGSGKDGNGSNQMGKMLMKLRDNLRMDRNDPSNGSNANSTTARSSSTQHLQQKIQHQEDQKQQPDVLVMANSHFTGFDSKAVHDVHMVRAEVYTIKQANDYVTKSKQLPPTVILHQITNDVKDRSPMDCVRGIRNLIHTIQQQHGSRVLVSLGVPSLDHRFNQKLQAVFHLLRVSTDIELIDHHPSFNEKGRPKADLFRNDNHPNEDGLRRIVLNCKRAICKV